MAGSWLIASVFTVFMTHRSSMILPVCGNNSLIQVPFLPCWVNLNFEPMTGKLFWPEVMPVRRWPMRIESGSSVPVSFASFGLWSHISRCDGPPDWNR